MFVDINFNRAFLFYCYYFTDAETVWPMLKLRKGRYNFCRADSLICTIWDQSEAGIQSTVFTRLALAFFQGRGKLCVFHSSELLLDTLSVWLWYVLWEARLDGWKAGVACRWMSAYWWHGYSIWGKSNIISRLCILICVRCRHSSIQCWMIGQSLKTNIANTARPMHRLVQLSPLLKLSGWKLTRDNSNPFDSRGGVAGGGALVVPPISRSGRALFVRLRLSRIR